ncbi:antibiotic biosynthesis monooxygenase [Micrococcales bacterium 31B]|nr:antibiotic biosynthesis monooxygenase [Micrococcales bacterium 31B]
MNQTPDPDEVNVLALFHAKPECADEFKAALEAMAEATHREEGCILYSLQQGVDDPTRFAFVETWTSAEALSRHSQMPHLTEGADERSAMLREPATVIVTRSTGAGQAEQAFF